MQDAILIEGLKCQALVGILPWEKQVKQPLVFDLRLYLSLKAAADSDALANTVDYAEVAQHIDHLTHTHHALVETVAERTCQMLFSQYPNLEAISLTVRKPAAVPQAEAVGVTLHRKRKAS